MKLIIALSLLLIGCSAEKEINRVIETIVKRDTIRVQMPAQFDTVVIHDGQGETIKYIVKVDTHKVYITAKPKIIETVRLDTIVHTIYREVTKQDDGFFQGIKLTDILIGALILIVLGGIGFILRQFGVIR